MTVQPRVPRGLREAVRFQLVPPDPMAFAMGHQRSRACAVNGRKFNFELDLMSGDRLTATVALRVAARSAEGPITPAAGKKSYTYALADERPQLLLVHMPATVKLSRIAKQGAPARSCCNTRCGWSVLTGPTDQSCAG